jgi:hypothetical protein
MSGGMDFVKLYASIVTSSVWLENDSTLRVWIYMLATADENGYVGASVGGLAHQSRVSREDCRKALDIFLAPDEDSRDRLNNPLNDGRRIEVVEGGWRIINVRKYRDMRTPKQVADAERQSRHRAGVTDRDSHTPSQMSHDVASEEEEELRVVPPPPPQPLAHAQSSTGSTAQALVSIMPPEFRPDMQALLELVPNVTAWTSEMRAALDGMHGKPVTLSQLGQAVRDYVASGKPRHNPNLRSFRRFIRGVLEGDATPREEGAYTVSRKGKTLLAAKLLATIRLKKHPQYPGSISPTWSEGLDAKTVEAVKPFLSRIFGDDAKGEGTLLAQLARALEEAE